MKLPFVAFSLRPKRRQRSGVSGSHVPAGLWSMPRRVGTSSARRTTSLSEIPRRD